MAHSHTVKAPEAPLAATGGSGFPWLATDFVNVEFPSPRGTASGFVGAGLGIAGVSSDRGLLGGPGNVVAAQFPFANSTGVCGSDADLLMLDGTSIGGNVALVGRRFHASVCNASTIIPAAETLLDTTKSLFPIKTIFGTLGQQKNIFRGDYAHPPVDPGEAIAAFYASLLARQEPLGKEFEKILQDNLWELYSNEI
jgi:hypothetical protein